MHRHGENRRGIFLATLMYAFMIRCIIYMTTDLPRHRLLRYLFLTMRPLIDLDAQLTEVLLVPHVLVGLLGLVESKDLLVDDGLDAVCFDGAVHFFKLKSAADEDAADGADVVLWLVLVVLFG